MYDLAVPALDTAKLRGATYADVRVMHLRQRDLTTKNGKIRVCFRFSVSSAIAR
jgi:hypothetical protein